MNDTSETKQSTSQEARIGRIALRRPPEGAATESVASAAEQIVESANFIICILDSDGRLTYCNPAVSAVVGYAPGDLEGELITHRLGGSPDQVEALTSLVTDMNRSDIIKRVVTVTDAAGDDRVLSWNTKCLDRSTVGSPMFIAFATDVTRQRRARQALAQSEQLHRITLSEISDAVFITNDDLRFTYICPNVHVIFGWTSIEVHEMRSIADLLGGNLFSKADLDHSGELTNIERTIQDKSGTSHVLLINIKRVSIGAGTILFSCRDITDRKQAERKLESAHEALKSEREELARKNIAMREVLRQIDAEKCEIGEQVQANVDRVVLPIVRSLQGMNDPMVREYAGMLKTALSDVTSAFTHSLESRFRSLSPREIEICNLIRSGYSTKQIATTLKTSVDTVKNQRKAIRRKLGISKTDANLESLLRSL